jgi:hypothetical protein
MLCDQVREHLSAYLDRELTADLSAAVRVHLDTCAECRALADDLRATVNLLGRLPERRAPGHLAGDVMREIERRGILAVGAPVEPQPEDRMLPMRRARAWPRALAVAATLVLAVGIGIFAYLSDIGRQAAPAPESGVVRKATDASKSSDWGAVAMGPAPKAAPSDDYTTRQPAPAKKAADKSSDNLLASAAAAKKEAEGRKFGGQLHAERPEAPSPNYSLAARESNAPAKEPAQAVTGEMATKLDASDGGSLVVAKAEKMPAVELKVVAATSAAPSAALPSAPPVAEREKVADLAYVGRGLPSKQALTEIGAAPAAPSAAPAPVARDEIAAAAGGIQVGMQAAGAAPRRAFERREDRALLEKTMLAVAEGDAGVEQLSRAASGEALREAGNQLVLRVESPDQADRSLVELFKAAGWRPLAVDRERSALKRTEEENSRGVAGGDPSAKAGNYEVRKLVPGGAYYRATRDGENVWLVLADRDSLSRFGSRLAQAQGLTVSAGSSADFLAIRQLQSQIRESQSAKAVPADRRFSSDKDVGAAALAMNDKAPPPAAAHPVPPASAAPAPASGELRKMMAPQEAPAAPAGAAAIAPTAAPAELLQEAKFYPSRTAAPGLVATAGRAPTSYGVEGKAGGRFGGEGGSRGGAAAMSDLGAIKAKQDAKPQGVSAEAPAASAADRILLVIRVQPVEASRAEVVPADSKSAEKPAP